MKISEGDAEKLVYKNWVKEALFWERECRKEYSINDNFSPLYWKQLHKILFCVADNKKEGLMSIDIENGETEYFELTGYFNTRLSDCIALHGETAYINTLTQKGISHFYKLE